MALTGLFLCTFLIVHLLGNLQLLLDDGGYSFNVYAKFMTTFLPIKIMSYVLYASILFHAVDGFILLRQNKKARPTKYAYNQPSANSSLSSRMMGLLGTLILLFIISHMAMYWGQMKWGGLNMILYSDTGEVLNFLSHDAWAALPMGEQDLYVKSLYEVVANSYTTGMWGLPGIAWVIIYVVAQIVLGFHLWHGFASAFQSLGMRHKKYTPIIALTGKAFSVLIALAFSAIPITMYICFVCQP